MIPAKLQAALAVLAMALLLAAYVYYGNPSTMGVG